MKLEKTLTELDALVDYGTYYLEKASRLNIADFDDELVIEYAKGSYPVWMLSTKDEILQYVGEELMDDVLDRMDSVDFVDYLEDRFEIDDLFSTDHIAEFVENNFNIEQIYDESYIKDYVTETYPVDEVYDTDDILDELNMYDVRDYVSSHFSVSDMVEWSR